MCTCQTPEEKAEDAKYRAECEAECEAAPPVATGAEETLSVRDDGRAGSGVSPDTALHIKRDD
jgi:hypothetical protein